MGMLFYAQETEWRSIMASSSAQRWIFPNAPNRFPEAGGLKDACLAIPMPAMDQFTGTTVAFRTIRW